MANMDLSKYSMILMKILSHNIKNYQFS